MINGKRRRMSLFLLGLCLVLIAAIGFQMAKGIGATREASTVTYGVAEIVPAEREVCPGGVIHYPVSVVVTVDHLPTQAEIAEAWCKIGLLGTCYGVQPGGMEPQAKRLPLLRPKNIESIAVRNVPPNLSPGEWEFWHSSADTTGETVGYIVGPITITNCEVSK